MTAASPTAPAPAGAAAPTAPARAGAAATLGCASCELELHHCHGLLVEHDDGTTTCVDGCGGPRAVHDELVGCAEVGMGCCGAADEGARAVPEELAWAA